MFIILPLIWIVILASFYYYTRIDFIRKGNKLPSPPALPFVGHALLFLGNTETISKMVRKITKDFNGIVAIWLGPILNILVFKADDIEAVLKASNEMEKSYQYKFLHPWLGEGILITSGVQFRESKKVFIKAFNTNILKEYTEIFNEIARTMVENLKKDLDREEFDIYPYLSFSMMRVLLETSLGVDKDTMTLEETLNYGKSVEKLGHCFHLRMTKVWLYPEIIFRFSSLKKIQDSHINTLNELTYRVLLKRKAEYKIQKNQIKETGENIKKWNKFVDNFFEARKENGQLFTEKEIKDEIMMFMFAGQDTTTVSLGFALSLLGIYQDVQDKVVDELVEILGDCNKNVTYEDAQKMKYLEQVVQETWRLFPPVPAIARRATKDINLGGHTIPKGCNIGLGIMLLHRDSEQFPDPNIFNPDNFTPDKIKARHPYSFIPFSANYRACLGPKYAMLVIKIFLANILLNYKVFSKRTMKDFTLTPQMTLKRKEGHLIRLEIRQK